MSHEHKTPIKTIKIKKIVLNSNMILKFIQNQKTEREDVLFVANQSEPIFQRYPNLIIVNKFNMISNTNRTVAKFTENGNSVELSSDCVTKLLGQKNYDTIFNAVSSVFNQTLKLDAIMGLLTKEDIKVEKSVKHKSISRPSQTDESRIVKLKRAPKRRIRCSAYAVLDNPDPLSSVQKQPLNSEPQPDIKTDDFIDTKDFFNEDDNISNISWDNLSINSNLIPNSLINPQEVLDSIKYGTEEVSKYPLKLIDGSVIELQTKPQDLFHIATPENLIGLTVGEQKKLLVHQAYLHWKHCLEVDADGNLPLHAAVLENDVYLLKKHCIVMKTHQESLDITGVGGLSALQLSIHTKVPQCTNILLKFGAKVTQTDSECKTLLHLAAESSVECIQEILGYCRIYPRKILSEKAGLWTPDLEFKSDEEISSHLIYEFCSVFDDEGFTPLMLACMNGYDAIVGELVQAAPKTVNLKSPLSGNTALHICISAAYSDAEQSDNNSKITQRYLNAIALLSKHGSELNIPNDSGITVAMLLGEYNEISQVLSNRFINEKQKCDSFMLVKEEDDIKVEPIKFTKQPKFHYGKSHEPDKQTKDIDSKKDPELKKDNSEIDTQKTTSDPKKVVILENIPILPGTAKPGQIKQGCALKVTNISQLGNVKLFPNGIHLKQINISSNQNKILSGIVPVIIKPTANASYLLKDKNTINFATIQNNSKDTNVISKLKSSETNEVVVNVNNIPGIKNTRKRKLSDAT